MGKTANVYIFECGMKKYFFDVNQNAILQISDQAYDHMTISLEVNHILENSELEELYNKGYLSYNRPECIKHPCSNYLKDVLGNSVAKICLQITQECNFRCKYCVYSGGYYNREHSKKEMPWEIAKRSINFLINHSFDADMIDIGFYGGEPLMRYDFIEKCIDYAVLHTEGKKLSFSITTNGSLLTDKMVKKFLKSNVNLVISLDGPREVQDRNRCFINGKGTFDVVYNNIERLLRTFPQLNKRLSFNMVIDQEFEMKPVIDFVTKGSDIMRNADISATTISEGWKKTPVNENAVFREQWRYGEFRYMLHMLDRLDEGNKDLRLWKDEFLSLKKFAERTKKNSCPLQKCEHHSGPCVPGQLRLFISVSGLFFPCERVSESTNEMVIGDIDHGFNYHNINKLLNIGSLTEEECKRCFAIRNCSICATSVDDGGTISRKRKLEACIDTKYTFQSMLKDLCALDQCGYRIDE